jgi:hypothetical protein
MKATRRCSVAAHEGRMGERQAKLMQPMFKPPAIEEVPDIAKNRLDLRAQQYAKSNLLRIHDGESSIGNQ